MRILVDDKLLEFSDDNLAWMYIDQGDEAEVYQYRDEALKIYKPGSCDKLRLSEEEAKELMGIDTNRLLLPRKLIRDADSGEFIGYTTPFITKATTTGIIRMKMINFIDEMDIIQNDIMTLTNNYVEVADFGVDNTIYNGKIYLVDPGSYRIRTVPSLMRFVRSNNSFSLNTYVKNELFAMAKLTKKEKTILDDVFSDYDSISDVMKETAIENESVRQYVKRMTR